MVKICGINNMLKVKRLKNNKKGALIDIAFYGLVMTIFAIVVIVSIYIAGEMNTKINEMSDTFPENSIKSTNAVVVKATNTLDSSFMLLVVLLGIFTLVLAALVRVHPIFIPFFFIGWLVTIFVAGIFSNIYQGVADSAQLAGTVNSLSYMNTIMDLLPMVIGIFGILLMIVMYKLWSVEQ